MRTRLKPPTVQSAGYRTFDLRLGYTAPHNYDCVVRGNVVLAGSLSINHFRQVGKKNNLVLRTGDERPQEPLVVLRPNRYDDRRAHLAVFNWDAAREVRVVVSEFLERGDRFRLMNPRQLRGEPVLEGRYTGEPIALPIEGEFAAWIVLRDKQPTVTDKAD